MPRSSKGRRVSQFRPHGVEKLYSGGAGGADPWINGSPSLDDGAPRSTAPPPFLRGPASTPPRGRFPAASRGTQARRRRVTARLAPGMQSAQPACQLQRQVGVAQQREREQLAGVERVIEVSQVNPIAASTNAMASAYRPSHSTKPARRAGAGAVFENWSCCMQAPVATATVTKRGNSSPHDTTARDGRVPSVLGLRDRVCLLGSCPGGGMFDAS